MKHTDENWTWSYGAEHLPSVGSYGFKICDIAAIGDKVGDFYPESEANAERIVACVNACAGLNNIQLKYLAQNIREGNKARITVSRLEAERDELKRIAMQDIDAMAALQAERDQLVQLLKTAIENVSRLGDCAWAYTVAKKHPVTPSVQQKADFYEPFAIFLEKYSK